MTPIAPSSTPQESPRPTVPALASRLEELILERGLAPGDRFLTAAEAAAHLRVRRDAANRALQVLAQRGRIERRQRRGATVTEPPEQAPVLARVLVLVQEDHERDLVRFPEAAQVGLHGALVGCDLRVEVVPTGGASGIVEPLVREALRGGERTGLVLVRCDYPTQRLARDSGLPAVLHGTPYAGIGLPSVDVDGKQAGTLLVESLIARGAERIVVVRRDRALPGDRAFMAGARAAVRAAHLDGRSIAELELAPYPELVRAELAAELSAPGMVGVVCATAALADAALEAGRTAGRTPGVDLHVHAGTPRASGRAPYATLAPTRDDEWQGAALGQLLAAARAGEAAPALLEPVLVPCRIVEPEAG